MANRPPPPDHSQPARVAGDAATGELATFGLTGAAAAVTAAHDLHLAQLATGWPFAFSAQFLATAIAIVTTIIVDPAPIHMVAEIGGGVAIATALASSVLAVPALARWPGPLRLRLLLPGLAALALGLLELLWLTVRLPTGAGQLGAFVAVSSAIGITATVIQPVRAATLAFAAGLVAGLVVLSATPVVVAVALLFFGCLAIAVRRLARREVERALAQAHAATAGEFAARMVTEFEDHGTGWFWETDRQGRLTYLSRKVANELSPGRGDPLGCALTDVFQMDSDAPATERTLAFHLSSRTSFSEYSVRPAGDDAAERWWSITGRPVIDEFGRFGGFIGSGSDLTERRRSEAEITRLALFDGLTGLANRQRMRLSLDKMLNQQAGPYRATTLFLLDLDRFKTVNDTLGHQAGDVLLKQVAQRLGRVVGDAGLCGRLGGDEFQVLLPGNDQRERLAELATRIIAALSQPYYIAGQSVAIGCSIGIAIAPEHGTDSETLVRSADLALYAAKGDGRGVHRFYSPDLLLGAQSRKQLEDDLRVAMAEGHFHLAYQPVVSTRDTRIVGFEALLRWNHPTRGAVPPSQFVPVAEDCGLIGAIGEWVLRTACAEAASWPSAARVAVNVSPLQFASPALPALVASALAASQLDPARLELEITEGVFLDQSTSSDKMFTALKALGIRLALDDFGTGYSSLGYLRTAPFDKIKIDQSFVRGAAVPGNRNAAIIRAIVTLADTLGMETTAEGVENQDEIELVRQLGCSHIQGYVYGKPMLAEEVMRQLSDSGEIAEASGYKVSRPSRATMLRRARLSIGDSVGHVRIRNLSSTGAMIDGIDLGEIAEGSDVLIEVLDDQMFPATVRWAQGGRAGLQFARQINLDRLTPSTPGRIRRLG
jgi:diguanylate cyclase (GGDEF)-like protein